MNPIDYYRTKDNNDLHIILRTPNYDIHIGTIKSDRYKDQTEAIEIINKINNDISQIEHERTNQD